MRLKDFHFILKISIKDYCFCNKSLDVGQCLKILVNVAGAIEELPGNFRGFRGTAGELPGNCRGTSGELPGLPGNFRGIPAKSWPGVFH